jgi:hypothetical protein
LDIGTPGDGVPARSESPRSDTFQTTSLPAPARPIMGSRGGCVPQR